MRIEDSLQLAAGSFNNRAVRERTLPGTMMVEEEEEEEKKKKKKKKKEEKQETKGK